MKKRLTALMVTLVLLGVALRAADQEKEGTVTDQKLVIRTYQLKHVDPRTIEDLVAPLTFQRRSDSISKLLVVGVSAENVKTLEELLAKFDVERPQVTFRIFTLLASQKAGASLLEVPELADVVGNLRRVLGFKSYILDGVSATTVRSGSRYNQLELNSKINGLKLDLESVAVDLGEGGKRRVRFGLNLQIEPQIQVLPKDQSIYSHGLIRTEQTVVVENGTLVAGVSKIGEAGDALVLVIQASIQ